MKTFTVIYKKKNGEEVSHKYEYETKRVPYLKIFEAKSENILPLSKIIEYLKKKEIKTETPRIEFINIYRKVNKEEKENITKELGVNLPKSSRRSSKLY